MNIPNALTLLRMLLAPAVVYVYHHYGHLYGAAVLVAAYCTDFLDGYIARRANQITRLGMMLDPLADKIIMAAVLLCMFDAGRIPVWCVWVMLGQATYLVAGGVALIKRIGSTLPSNGWGKSATVLFFASAVCLFPSYPWLWVERAGRILLYGAVILMVCAACSYTVIALAKVKEQSHAVDK